MAYPLLAALNSKFIDEVFVSTDSNKIANISKKYGAEVPFLRKKYNDDFSPVSHATIHTLNSVSNYCDEKYDIVVQLMANCPLRNETDLKKSIASFKNKKRDFQISCFKFGWMNPWWSFKINKKNKAKPLFPKQLKQRSQDLPNLFCPTGAIWIAKTKKLIKTKSFYGKNFSFEELNWVNAIDIDDIDVIELKEIIQV